MPLDGSTITETDVEIEPAVLILQRARDFVSRGWTQGQMARRWWGWKVSPLGDDAVRFCALGAIHRAAYDLGFHAQNNLTNAGRGHVNRAVQLFERAYARPEERRGIVSWNDTLHRTQGEVLYMFDRATRLVA